MTWSRNTATLEKECASIRRFWRMHYDPRWRRWGYWRGQQGKCFWGWEGIQSPEIHYVQQERPFGTGNTCYSHSSPNGTLQNPVAYVEFLEQPVCAALRYVFYFTKYVHIFQNTHRFSHCIQPSQSISCCICYIHSLAISTHRVSRLLTCHSSSFFSSISCHGSIPPTHYLRHPFWYYSIIPAQTLLIAVHLNLCITTLTPAPFNSIFFSVRPRYLSIHTPAASQSL